MKAQHSLRAAALLASLTLSACGDDATPSGATPTYPGTDALGDTPVAAPFGPSTNTPRTIQVSVSSESLGQTGFPYTATPAEGDLVFVDGWEVRFTRILVTVKNVRLNAPGTEVTDPGSVGASVALNPRAYAVNAHKAGPLTGASGGEETAIPLFVFTAADSGAPLDTTTRYALSYDIVAATNAATNVNLDASDLTAYRTMITRGWTQFVEGDATYRGVAPTAGSPFESYPRAVHFTIGFGAPTRYLNCKNPDNGAEELPGVQPSSAGRARAQLTFHQDHAFWEALNREDPPLHFDQFASRAQGSATMATVTLDDLVGVVPTNLRDRMMRPVPDRGGQTMGYTARTPAALSFDTSGTAGITDLRDFVAFSARASAHLNADGLCAVRPSGPITF